MSDDHKRAYAKAIVDSLKVLIDAARNSQPSHPADPLQMRFDHVTFTVISDALTLHFRDALPTAHPVRRSYPQTFEYDGVRFIELLRR